MIIDCNVYQGLIKMSAADQLSNNLSCEYQISILMWVLISPCAIVTSVWLYNLNVMQLEPVQMQLLQI